MKNLITISFAVTVLLFACNQNDNKIELMNKKASLPESFNFDRKGLKVMASLINKKAGTMAVLYANAIALNNAVKDNNQPVMGEVLALVTWKQQDDAHWFGGEIPGALQSVELVKTNTNKAALSIAYEKYSGSNLTLIADTLGESARIKYVLSQQPSVMP
jgi:hypothetical protein